ncbi:hypothetical protein [Tumebacillus flagellatus]|uniref:Uncharacterized protein n=1 Tax=Tumebacillus flagellatus TaxID=1157490 RepID=A0A074LUA8_9BACL|nr:hypothetical protein [Tumebacillus flagellatus]KEO84150.1 hypothetical protein EL26_06705 [Tumebacillus flagellatus]
MIDSLVQIWDEVLRLLTRQMTEAANAKVRQVWEQLDREAALARRQKIDEINRSILSLNILILKIEKQLSEIQLICPDAMMTTVKPFLIELKQRKGELEVRKMEFARARAT